MKSAYELAMERLNKSEPSVTLTDEQKKALAELDSKYAAKIAEKEIFLNKLIEKAAQEGDFEAMEQHQKQLASERSSLSAKLESEKEAVRQQGKSG